MKYFINFRMAGKTLCAVATALACFQLSSQAQIVTLTDGNSLAQIDPHSQAGMFNWSVQGFNQLYQQWFWFRVGDAPGSMQHSIDTIGTPVVSLYGTREMTSTYTAANFTLSIDYLLTGGSFVGPGQVANSDIGESIRIINTSATTLVFHFFQYSDFDLGGPGNDSVQLGRNLRGQFNDAFQQDAIAGLTETVTTPGASHGEVDYFANTRTRLNTIANYTLNDSAGPVGTGDVTWALEWDLTIAPGASALISKDKYLSVVVPEPSALAISGLGLVFLALHRRRVAK
jgi:hypothetical protein